MFFILKGGELTIFDLAMKIISEIVKSLILG
jgi:hypothetical protein